MDPELRARITARRPERITARRSGLGALEERLVEHLSEARAERDERAVAVRVRQRRTSATRGGG
ncbi:hypothetical protein ACWEPR_25885 [Streptomyces sp. NPDC004290]